MVVRSSAVTTTWMSVSPPSVRGISSLALPLTTSVPLTVTVASLSSAVGVTNRRGLYRLRTA